MSEPLPPPPPVPEKKKTSPLVWIAVGCVGLLVAAGVLLAVGGFFAAKKFQDVAGNALEDLEENPAKTVAEFVVRANPDLELVDSDDEAETFTIRDKRSGETITVDWSEIQEGRFSFEAGDRDVTIEAGGESGELLSIREGDDTVATIGGANTLPSWVPLPDGVEPTGQFSYSSTDGLGSGAVSMSYPGSIEEVQELFAELLRNNGFEIRSTVQVGTASTVMATSDMGSIELLFASADANETEVQLKYRAGS